MPTERPSRRNARNPKAGAGAKRGVRVLGGRGRAAEDRPLLRLTLEPPGLTVTGGGTALEISTTEKATGPGRAGLRGDVRGGLVRVERSGVRVAGLVVSFPRSRLTLDGTVQPQNHGMKAALQVHADPLDLDDFLDRLQPVRAVVTRRSAGASSRGKARRKQAWPDVAVHLDLRRVHFRRRTVDTIAGDLAIERGAVSLAPISFRTAGGVFHGAIEGPGPAHSGTRVSGTLKAPDPAAFFELAGLPAIVSGALDAELDVTFPSRTGWKSGGRGSFRLGLEKGRLHTIQLLAEVLSPLVPGMVSGVLSPFRKLIELDALGTRFERLHFAGELKPGRVHLTTGHIEAFGMTVQVTGTMSLASGELDLRGTVRIEASLLEWIGVERIMGPPIFTIPVTVRGALPTPRVLPDLDELKKFASGLSLRRLPGRLLGDVNRRLRSLAGLSPASAPSVRSATAASAASTPKAPSRRTKRAASTKRGA